MAFESGTTDLGATIGGGGVTSLNGLTGALTLVAGSGITITPAGSNITIASTGGGGSGTVTSVAMTTPGVLYNVTGSPITTSGTLALTLIAQTANTVLAGPSSGGSGNPSFRALVGADFTGSFTSGSIIFAGATGALSQDNANFFWNDTNQSIGIGQTPALGTFIDATNSSAASKTLQLTGYGTGSTVGTRGRFARGTAGSPTAAQSGDIINFWSARGYGTSQFAAASTGAINAIAGETFTNTSNLTYLTFNTTPTASVTSTENFRIASTGSTIGPQSASTAIHSVNGGLNMTTKTVTANYTVDTTTSDYYILCNAAGAITVTLPALTAGRTLVIKDISGNATTNNITIARHASENIEGLAASYVLVTSYQSAILFSDGTNWWVQ